MADIFVTGNSSDREIEGLIKQRLNKSYTISYIKDNSFEKTGKGYNLIVLDSEKPIIKTTGAVLLLKENGVIPDFIPENTAAIINADNEELAYAA